jgi:hypothetical protein
VPVEKKGKDRREKFWSYNFASKETAVKDGPLLVNPLPLTRDNGAFRRTIVAFCYHF